MISFIRINFAAMQDCHLDEINGSESVPNGVVGNASMQQVDGTCGDIVDNWEDRDKSCGRGVQGIIIGGSGNIYVEFNPTEECECDETRGWMFYYTEIQSISKGVLHTIDGALGDSPVSLQQSAA